MNRKFVKRMIFSSLVARYSDGGTQPPADPPADPAAKTDPAPPTDPPAKTYTESDLDAAKAAAVAEFKQHLEESKDYDKMTPEEKVAHLEKQMADEKLSTYTTGKLTAAELPPELLPFVKGKDETDTDERIKSFKAVYDKGVQAGVEKRFKGNGYTPKGSAVTTTTEADKTKRQRGVSIK